MCEPCGFDIAHGHKEISITRARLGVAIYARLDIENVTAWLTTPQPLSLEMYRPIRDSKLGKGRKISENVWTCVVKKEKAEQDRSRPSCCLRHFLES
jgi:hypothetical protein